MLEFQTDVVIVGNGPAGISLSAFLSGWHPYPKEHPDSFINEHLIHNLSLLEQDLSWYLPEHELNAGPSINMYSGFFDKLMRPTTSTPETQNCLDYVYRPEDAINHIVLGNKIGGSWQNYDSNMSIISLSNWMDLPGFSLNEWANDQSLPTRLPSGIVRDYFCDYVKRMGIEKNFMEHTTVTNVSKVSSSETREQFWLVQGFYSTGTRFSILCKKVVLACGKSQQKMLNVEGELNGSAITYNCCEMKQILKLCPRRKTTKSKPVVIVGDGISSSDSVLHCLANNIKVIHVFKRSTHQLKSTMLSRLNASIYPEYARVFDLMIGRSTHKLYKCLPESSVQRIKPNKQIIIKNADGIEKQLDYKCLAVSVGLQASISMLEDKYDFLSDEYQSFQDPSLFVIGSVAGDHFVRFLIGGSFRVAQKLLDERRPLNNKIPFCCCFVDVNANSICPQSLDCK